MPRTRNAGNSVAVGADLSRVRQDGFALFFFLYWALRRFLELIVLLGRRGPASEIELLVLRHEVVVLRRQVPRPQLRRCDWALFAALAQVLRRNWWPRSSVRAATLRRWPRMLVGPAGRTRLGARVGQGSIAVSTN